jgi:hypothetical protein
MVGYSREEGVGVRPRATGHEDPPGSIRRHSKSSPHPIMLMIIKVLIEIHCDAEKYQVIEIKPVKCLAMRSALQTRGRKIEGKFRYVTENKCRKNVNLQAFHYVVENT